MQDIRYVADGLHFPEGPIAMPDGSVILVEIAAGRLSSVDPAGSVSLVANIGGGPNGAAIGPDGACYICNSGGFRWHVDDDGMRPMGQADDYAGGRIERVDLQTGEVVRIYDRSENGPLGGPNDLVFDRTGGFWFTDTGVARPRDMDRGGLYYAQPDGSSIRETIFPMHQANGVGLSPEEDVVYVAETVTGRIWAFDLDGPGQIRPLGWPSPNGGRLLASLPGYRLLDSLAVDGEGNISVATLYDGGVVTISRCGEIIEDLALPDRFITNICFGGENRQTAYVTMSQTGRLAAIDWKRPGLRLNFQ